jgi:DNA end-binding protein Ku
MPRAIWKGAVSFGLVYIPVELYSASKSVSLDLDLLDSRDFAPVGYQRINKRTGEVVDWGDIVKGYQYKKGQYVALSEEDFRQANVKAAQTIDIHSFTDASGISPEFYETPYYLVPIKGGEKAYALLREALLKTGKAGVGSMVMRGRQHVGVILPAERMLMFITLRFADELKPASELEMPASAKSAKVSPREVSMAERLVEEMTAEWNPADYHDSYREDLMKRINEKIRKKQTHVLTPKSRAPKEERQSAEIIDLMSVLKKSLETRGGGADAAPRRRKASGSRARSNRRAS